MKLKIEELLDLNNSINIGINTEQNKINPLMLHKTGIGFKGKLIKISNEIETYIKVLNEKIQELYIKHGEEIEGTSEIKILPVNENEFNEDYKALVLDTIEVNLEQYQITEKEFDENVGKTELPLITFAKYLIKYDSN